MVDLEEVHFLFNFDNKEDYHHVLTGGPWIIMNHYLTMRKSKPNFNPEESKEATTPLWIRLPRLPIEWFDENTLFQIGSKVGKPLKTEFNSASSTRGKYARICVEVEFAKPLIPSCNLEGRKYRFEYEFLPFLCFTVEEWVTGKIIVPPENQKRQPPSPKLQMSQLEVATALCKNR